MALFPNGMLENGIKNNTIPPLPPGIGGIFAFKACAVVLFDREAQSI